MRHLAATALTATIAGGLLAPALALGAASPAAAAADAATGRIAVSADGHVWSADLTRPLFDPAVRWVPGDVRTAWFYVRNQGPGRAALDVTPELSGDLALVRMGDLSLAMRVGGDRWRPLTTGRATALGRLARGDRARVEIRAAFRPESANATQHRSVRLALSVRLTDATETEPPPPGTSSTPGWLPGTGSPVSVALLALILSLLATGVALVTRSSRREPR